MFLCVKEAYKLCVLVIKTQNMSYYLLSAGEPRVELSRRDELVRHHGVVAAGHGGRAHGRQHRDLLGERRRGPQQGALDRGHVPRRLAGGPPAHHLRAPRQHARHGGEYRTTARLHSPPGSYRLTPTRRWTR